MRVKLELVNENDLAVHMISDTHRVTKHLTPNLYARLGPLVAFARSEFPGEQNVQQAIMSAQPVITDATLSVDPMASYCGAMVKIEVYLPTWYVERKFYATKYMSDQAMEAGLSAEYMFDILIDTTSRSLSDKYGSVVDGPSWKEQIHKVARKITKPTSEAKLVELVKKIPGINQKVTWRGKSMPLRRAIIDMNDDLHWTRDRIANQLDEWADRGEIHIDFETR